MDIKKLQVMLSNFSKERDWDQFHTPKNLVMALAGEVGELLDHFQWKTAEESELGELSDAELSEIYQEVADVALYLLRLADKLDIDLEKSMLEKLSLNALKYPVEKSKGVATKYDKL